MMEVKEPRDIRPLLAVKLNIEVVCPGCRSMKIVKNGVKKTGKQNLLCKDCRLQFQWEYSYKGADKAIKEKLVKMLLGGSGVRDCAAVVGVSLSCVPGTILKVPGYKYSQNTSIISACSWMSSALM